MLAAVGCQPTEKPIAPATTKPETPPRVLVVDDAELAEAIATTYRATFEAELEIKHATRDEVAVAKRLPADVVVFPAPLLGDLAGGERLSRLPEDAWNDAEWARDDLFDEVRKRELVWGRNPIGVSLGHPQLTLWRRGEGAPPETWTAWAEELGRRERSEEGPAPVIVPLASGEAWLSLLTIAAGYVAARDQISTLFELRTMEPRIDRPPFVRALTELKTLARSQQPPFAVAADSARNHFLRGQASAALTWPGGKPVDNGQPFTVHPLPGVKETYRWSDNTWQPTEDGQTLRVPLIGATGILAAVTADAKRPKQAARVLTWLSGKEASGRIAGPHSGLTLFRTSQVAAPQRWVGAEFSPSAAQRYAEIVRDAQTGSLALFVPRLPRWREYTAALDTAVQQAVIEDADPQATLTAAADEWRKITAEVGVNLQRRGNERALNFAD